MSAAPGARITLAGLRNALLLLTLAVAGVAAVAQHVVPAVGAGARAWAEAFGAAWGRLGPPWSAGSPLDWLLVGGTLTLGAYLLLCVVLPDVVFALVLLGDRLLGSKGRERRHLVVLIDGTWNHPGQTQDGRSAPTNVTRFWRLLVGEPGADEAPPTGAHPAATRPPTTRPATTRPATTSPATTREAPSASRAEAGSARPRARIAPAARAWFTSAAAMHGQPLPPSTGPADGPAAARTAPGAGRAAPPGRQLALYYAGLGNPAEHTLVGRLLGGAFGWGAVGLAARVRRDLARYRTADTQISVLGFSRGAAVARLVVRDLGRYGLPAWRIAGLLPVQAVRRVLLWACASRGRVGWLGAEARVEFVGLWDTVASFGLAKNVAGIPFQRLNVGMDFDVRRHARRVVHLLALDDERDAFQPTLLGLKPHEVGGGGPASADGVPRAVLTETWLAGVHGDVGGGRDDARLSSIGLELMALHALAWREASGGRYALALPGAPADLHAAARAPGLRHPEVGARWARWAREGTVGTHEENTVFAREVRQMPLPAAVHWTVLERVAHAPGGYGPAALLDLGQRGQAARALGAAAPGWVQDDTGAAR